MQKIIEKEKIENMIYEIRGKEVILDSDLAILYECKNGTKDINKAVKRNIARFPEDFYFQLTKSELENLRFQNGTLKIKGQGKYSKYLPHAFTEEGVAMLASVLKTDLASKMSVQIIRAFVYIRRYIANKNNILVNHEVRILKLEETFDRFKDKQLAIIYEGKIYDGISVLLDILKKARKEIIIIDNYIDKEILDILRNIDKTIVVMSHNLNKELIKKYNSQYKNVIFIENNPFHDRYIILDKKEVYVSGMSLKDIGKKYSYINKINEELFINELIKRIDELLIKI